MTYDFNANEALEMAIQIEKNGAAFYRKAASLHLLSGFGLMFSIDFQKFSIANFTAKEMHSIFYPGHSR